MAVLGFSKHPGPLPFATVRDAVKWLPRLTNGQIEIRGENGVQLEQRMVRIASMSHPHTPDELRARGHYVPTIYGGRILVLVHLEELPQPDVNRGLTAMGTPYEQVDAARQIREASDA